MSGILKNRKYWVLAFMSFLIIAFIVLHWYIAAILVSLIAALFIADILLVRNWMKPLHELYPQRPLWDINTLVIGETCSSRSLSSRFDLQHTLIITAPIRSVEASLLILKHVSSRLDGNQICIIAPSKELNNISVLDIPFLSLLTKLEMNLKDNRRERQFYIFYHPLIFIKFLCSLFSMPKEMACDNVEVIDYCKRKGFNLIFLHK